MFSRFMTACELYSEMGLSLLVVSLSGQARIRMTLERVLKILVMRYEIETRVTRSEVKMKERANFEK